MGWLDFDEATSRYGFTYSEAWLGWLDRFALSPYLPLTDAAPASLDAHSVVVRQFFENLLPEGRALDEVAASLQVSKGNVAGLLANIGRESAGALRIAVEGSKPRPAALRPVSREELSQRIRDRPEVPFSAWDGRVRLSIAGYQDKIAVLEQKGQWFLPDGDASSTHILKIDPKGLEHLHLTSNEFVTMRLAKAAGVAAAAVRLIRVPEPVLAVDRFDRRLAADSSIERLHIIDGCQALGLAPSFKYERQHGHGKDVAHLRDGASLRRLFGLLVAGTVPRPIPDRQQLLRWVIFQALAGNSDAHGKNLSFYSSHEGLALAPAYDVVSVLALPGDSIDRHWAMAIGDAFDLESLDPEEWLEFSLACNVPLRVLGKEVERLCTKTLQVVGRIARQCVEEGADPDATRRIEALVTARVPLLMASAKPM